MVKVWIKPMTRASRRFVYEHIKDEQVLKEVKEKVFLPKDAYQKRRGRLPMYDSLLITIGRISRQKAEGVVHLLEDRFHRPVVWWEDTYQDDEGNEQVVWWYILPWRDPETGESIKTGKGMFSQLREDIMSVISEE